MTMHTLPPNPALQPVLPVRHRRIPFFYELLLVFILLVGAVFRFVGILWGDFQYLHPDERFLVWVGSDIQPISTPQEALGPPPDTTNNPWRVGPKYIYPDCQSWGGYFDASCSPLNPNNRGHPFYVYGTLPMFITRYLVQMIYGHSGFNEMTIVGRLLSAIIDLFSVILVYAIASKAFSKRVGLLAAAFSAFTVLNIQQSHFFTMDTFASFFTLLALYFAVRVSLLERDKPALMEEVSAGTILPATEENAILINTDLPDIEANDTAAVTGPSANETSYMPALIPFSTRLSGMLRSPYFSLSIAFGVALGMAVASKLNAAPVAFVLPVAFGLVLWRKPPQQRLAWLVNAALYLGVAAFVSILIFRILQPYAFLGPGFLGLRPNPQWVANIVEQRNQAAGDIDFPPSLQWARRPLWFSAQNLIAWGLGLPLGILAFAAFLWAGWRMLKGDWPQHAVLWLWGAFYFTWQSLQFNPTMRYQMPTYPILAVYAAWGIFQLWEVRKRPASGISDPPRSRWAQFISAVAGSLVLAATFAWALAFTQVYARTTTRVAASEWIYQNIPGPLTLHIQSESGLYSQPISIPYGSTVQAGYPYQISFNANASGTLSQVTLAHVANAQSSSASALYLSLSTFSDGSAPMTVSSLSIPPTHSRASIALDPPVTVQAGQAYYLTLGLSGGNTALNACGPVDISLQTETETFTQTIPGPGACMITPQAPYVLAITPQETALMESVTLSQLADQTPASGPQTLSLTIGPTGDAQVVATASLSADFTPATGSQGAEYTLSLDRPISLQKGKNYSLSLALESGSGILVVQGSAVANEGEWDDGLPLRVGGYDAFGGIYTPGLNLNMYTDDNTDKLERFISVYDQAEYIFISSNRQWGSLPRLPERFPMTALHYRHLLGCPEERTIMWCYSVAQPGTFHGDLGFELVKVFQTDPQVGSLRVNDQFAEEAFTVYDHPKVLIFRKTAHYDSQHARQILSQADFSELVRITPKKAAFHLANLKLPSERLAEQTGGGTWSELFNRNAFYNRFQVLGVIVWYLCLSLLGWLVYPILRLALPGLPDHGYPLARTAGMLLLAYFTWLAGSVNIPFSRLTITIVILLLAVAGAFLAYRQRHALRQEWQSRRGYFLAVEGMLLAFFLLFLLVRLGNPDLWHPWKGGEKPMDFSYFNAILKSTSFPPYDPWYAGGAMNYYYWGYVFVGVLVKWLGIVPSFAYNLILPTLFSLVSMGAFSLGYNLSYPRHTGVVTADSQAPPGAVLSGEARPDVPPSTEAQPASTTRPFLVGLASALTMAVLGNLGTLRMIAKGWEQLGIPGGLTDTTGFFTRLVGFFSGLYQVLFKGAQMPYGLGEWYWLPSRAIPAPGDVEPITEFPIFTFLYGDLHAHMIALPIAMLALTWAMAVLLGKARWQSLGAGMLSFLLGGLAIGALYPTNLSDIYTYLPIGMLALGYAIYRYSSDDPFPRIPYLNPRLKRLFMAGAGTLLLVLLAYGLYLPYRLWYAQPYSQVIPWFGTHTPFVSYLTHWGLFLFLIISWMVWETREWMANTPLSALRKLGQYNSLITLGLVLLFLACLLVSVKIPGVENMSLLSKLPLGRGAGLVWFILPLAAWAGLLLLRPGLPDAKRLVLLLVGTGLLITLMVEVVVVRGDIGRMNTVFKFYLQVWALFAISAAAALGWLLEPVRGWLPGWRIFWRIAFGFLIFSALLFTLYGSMAKIKDRWVSTAPHTLDGMAYMPYATYAENYPGVTEATPVNERGINMDLSQDYRLILWMQQHIQGSPVIVEANSRNLYRWFSRYTIYTGLPGVLGWEWHQQQQRAINPPEWVTQRVTDIEHFYTTMDTDLTKQFLGLYGVKYIVLGQLEQVSYPGPGLDKFAAFNGVLWKEVYRDGSTVLYEVLP